VQDKRTNARTNKPTENEWSKDKEGKGRIGKKRRERIKIERQK
jgi:hypothetical protein